MIPAHSWPFIEASHLPFHVQLYPREPVDGVGAEQGPWGRHSQAGTMRGGGLAPSQGHKVLVPSVPTKALALVGKTQIVNTLADQIPFFFFGHDSLASIGRTSFSNSPYTDRPALEVSQWSGLWII